MISAVSDFENIKNSIMEGLGDQSHKATNIINTKVSDGNELFESLKTLNIELDNNITALKQEIDNIQSTNSDTFNANLTFSLSFRTIDSMFNEYKYLSVLFNKYSQLFNELVNEENIIKILDILRMIISDRRAILNDVINNVTKLQRLANDRIKMDMANGSDDDIDDLLNPDSL